MFTAFMMALTLTAVANVLITLACGPLLTALGAWLFTSQRLPLRTWLAICVAHILIEASLIPISRSHNDLNGSSPISIPLVVEIFQVLLEGLAATSPGC